MGRIRCRIGGWIYEPWRGAFYLPETFDSPSLADLTGPFVYARLMRSQADEDDGYPVGALNRWSERAREWASGGDPTDLPHVGATTPGMVPRDVFVYFISSAKERNPAAAVALDKRIHRDA